MAKIIRRYSYKFLAILVIASMFGFYFSFIDNSQAAQVSNRRDVMNNSANSATSNHTFIFTIQDSLDTTGWGSGSGGDATDTITITLGANFTMGGIDCGDVDIRFLAEPGTASSISGNANGGPTIRSGTNCPGSATTWGLFINGSVLTFYTPTTVQTHVATGTQMIVLIGSNATDQDTGAEWITNPAAGSSGPQTNTIGGTFGGTGSVIVVTLSGVEVSATVAETLTFTIAGLPGRPWSGTDAMSGCDAASPFTTDDDDGSTSLSLVTTTATTVPFGTITAGSTYQGCQRLAVNTNAAGGYTLSQRSNNPLRTAAGTAVIVDTTCDAGGCTPYIGAGWTNIAAAGLGVSCRNSATSNTCSGTGAAGTLVGEGNPDFQSGNDNTGGVNFVPFAAESLGFTSSTRFAVTSVAPWVTSTDVVVKAKYRVRILASQGAGTFTNVVSWIASAIFN